MRTKAVAGRPDVIFHLAASSRARPSSISTRATASISTARARCSRRSARSATATSRARLHLVDRGVRRAVPGRDPRRFPSHAAHLLRHAEGDRRTAARRLHAARLLRRHRASACRPIVVRPGKPNKAASGFFSGIIREPLAGARGGAAGRRDGAHTGMPARARRSASSSMPPGSTRDALGPRVNLTMPGVCCTVGEQIAALRKIAGEHVAARIRREPDPLIAKIVAGWPQRIDARRAQRAWLQGREQRSTRSSASISRMSAAAISSRDPNRRRCGGAPEINGNGACRCPPKWAHSRTRTNQLPAFGRSIAPARQQSAGQREMTRRSASMRMKTKLYLSAAAIGFAVLLSAPPAQLHAQQAPPAVAIDADDIGGVVTGPNGPEAGVWVIAETTDLPTRYTKMRRHRRPGPLRRSRPAEGQLQGLGARLWPGRFAEGAERARQASSICARCRRRTRRRPRSTIRRSTGTR